MKSYFVDFHPWLYSKDVLTVYVEAPDESIARSAMERYCSIYHNPVHEIVAVYEVDEIPWDQPYVDTNGRPQESKANQYLERG